MTPLRRPLFAVLCLLLPLWAAPRPCPAQPSPPLLVNQARDLAARERADPTTAQNAATRLRELQDLFGAMRFSGAFVGLEQVCPPQALAAMMEAVRAGRPEALPRLLSPCLLALATIGPLPPDAVPAQASGQPPRPAQSPPPLAERTPPGQPPAVPLPPQPAREPVSVTVSLPTTAKSLSVTPAVPQAAAPLSGNAGIAPDAAFPVTTVATTGGTARISLTDVPVIIEEGPPRKTPPTQAERQTSPFGAHPATFRGESPPFALASDLGIGWHRGVAWWVDIQSDADLADGRFDFSRLDAELSRLPTGMRTLLTIMLPARLRQDAPGGQPGSLAVKADGTWDLATQPAAYDAFVKGLVERYGKHPPAGVARVSTWQFENELDLSRARSDAAGYARLLTRTHDVVKTVDPKATVLIGGVSGEDFSRNFQAYYLPVLRQLGGKGFDVFDLHFFGRAGDYKSLAAVYGEARRALNATGFSRVPVWMTETATYSGAPAGLVPQSEAEQAAELARRAVFALGLGVRKVFWAMVREGFQFRNDLFDHAGLTTNARVTPDAPDGRPKMAYFTYRLLCAKLAGLDPTPTRLPLGPDVYAYRFHGPGGRAVVVAWADPAR